MDDSAEEGMRPLCPSVDLPLLKTLLFNQAFAT